MNLALKLKLARAAFQKAQDGPSLDAVQAAQAEYDACNLALAWSLPNRLQTSAERQAMVLDIQAAINRALKVHNCKVGECFNKGECDTCLRLHNSIFTDPPCVDHG